MNKNEFTQYVLPFLNSPYTQSFLLLFDDRDFLALLPINDWDSCFQDALRDYPYDNCIIIHDGSAPPLEMLEASAQNCYAEYNGNRYARPIRISEVVYTKAPATIPA